MADINVKPPAGVRAELKKGLEWHKQGHSGDGLVPATVSWARRMANGEPISRDKAVKMRAWLARHEVDKKGKGFSPGEPGFPSPGRVAWALWGGDPAVSWSNKLVRQIQTKKASEQLQTALDLKFADPVKAPKPAAGQEETYIDEIVPEEAIFSTAAMAAKEAAERIQRVAINAVQSAGVGGAVPPARVSGPAVAAALAALSVGVDKRLAQQASNLTYGLGRAQGLRASGANRYIYSNLAESMSCDACMEQDGTVFGEDELDVYAALPFCVADAMCNCLVIGLFD
jgi:hypothetical protein